MLSTRIRLQMNDQNSSGPQAVSSTDILMVYRYFNGGDHAPLFSLFVYIRVMGQRSRDMAATRPICMTKSPIQPDSRNDTNGMMVFLVSLITELRVRWLHGQNSKYKRLKTARHMARHSDRIAHNVSTARGIVGDHQNSPKMGPSPPGKIHVSTANMRRYRIPPLISKIQQIYPSIGATTNSAINETRTDLSFRRITPHCITVNGVRRSFAYK